jgi:DNA polymerase III alpha subunit
VADLVQALAVTRPGAAKRGGKETFLKRRRGAEPVSYAHPALEPVLKENRGVILFDDDVLGVIEALTGLPAAEADRLRKRLTDAGQAEEAGAAFLAMLEKKGVGRTAAAAVLDQLTKFKDYAFCKSHAVAYALIAWKECFARAHYPVPFWCAVLNHHHGNYPRRVYVEAAKRSGVSFHLPCVNRSQAEFTQEVGAVRTGLSAVRSLDASAVGLLLEERRQAGPFRDMSDFRRRVRLTPQDQALLVRAGCFDTWPWHAATSAKSSSIRGRARKPYRTARRRCASSPSWRRPTTTWATLTAPSNAGPRRTPPMTRPCAWRAGSVSGRRFRRGCRPIADSPGIWKASVPTPSAASGGPPSRPPTTPRCGSTESDCKKLR